jgi:hypothetical protein
MLTLAGRATKVIFPNLARPLFKLCITIGANNNHKKAPLLTHIIITSKDLYVNTPLKNGKE